MERSARGACGEDGLGVSRVERSRVGSKSWRRGAGKKRAAMVGLDGNLPWVLHVPHTKKQPNMASSKTDEKGMEQHSCFPQKNEPFWKKKQPGTDASALDALLGLSNDGKEALLCACTGQMFLNPCLGAG